ncbi:response regulator receiver protein [Oleidesulfovibrio alaskensis G20]|jgi:CheY-like chemotaxis protein|uniref:Response regulator receiver protein n=1 Tax=Oleidesulfovibrio alaskensis (strain ATCC BAA-1058 / DSM 17464 / G20) TaxID=207559 RepID=Q30UZ0_OLEA2|nr:response regulator [Oleidesulfovibrio alaskensis]ABB40506.1 response regulator receiver protein [Oleidesulfovibrio alaskensis G20]MBG0772758.1 response regulator [Oleidesulfovibrio alaskensis]MBL3583214.1 response regulator [Oleidesulfovibrio alaskensis]
MPQNILVVDDEMSFRFYLKTLFETGGYTVEAARNGSEGLQKARTKKPDLVVLDVMMPRKGGLEMYRGLRSDPVLCNVPVIMLSAVGAGTFAHALAMIGVAQGQLPPPQAYMEKPPCPEKLLNTVRTVLASHEQDAKRHREDKESCNAAQDSDC